MTQTVSEFSCPELTRLDEIRQEAAIRRARAVELKSKASIARDAAQVAGGAFAASMTDVAGAKFVGLSREADAAELAAAVVADPDDVFAGRFDQADTFELLQRGFERRLTAVEKLLGKARKHAAQVSSELEGSGRTGDYHASIPLTVQRGRVRELEAHERFVDISARACAQRLTWFAEGRPERDLPSSVELTAEDFVGRLRTPLPPALPDEGAAGDGDT